MQTAFDPWRTTQAAAEVWLAGSASTGVLAALQAARMATLFEAAATRSPLYQRVFAGRDPARTPLQDLPVAHKADLMRDFDHWVADPALALEPLRRFMADPANIARPYLGRYTVWETSGSTGEPAVFAQDAHAMAVYDALEGLRRPLARPLQRWLDPWGLAERQAFVGATGGHFASTVSVERLRRAMPGVAGRLRGISFLQPLAAVCAELEAFEPTVLATYPSAAVLLAEQQQAGRLQLHLNQVSTGGETLSEAQRNFVEHSFGCPVRQSYGASEFLALAFECARGGLHLNSDWVVLEPVDAQGRAVPPGQAGSTTLLTNLANHVQPLIRYDIGDRVTLLPGRCACGSQLPLIDVHGRDDATLQLATGRGQAPVKVVPLAVSTVLEDAGLFDFQLLQTSARDLLLQTGGHGPAGQAVLERARERLLDFLCSQGARGLRIRCRSDAPLMLGRSGKIRRVIVAFG